MTQQQKETIKELKKRALSIVRGETKVDDGEEELRAIAKKVAGMEHTLSDTVYFASLTEAWIADN